MRLKIADDIKRKEGCYYCQEKEPIILQFHHAEPGTKVASVSRLINNMVSIEEIIIEIDKCICVCGNCHAKLHAGLLPKPIKTRQLLQHRVELRHQKTKC